MADETNTSTELPDNVTMHEAVELMAKMGMGDDTSAPNAQPEGDAPVLRQGEAEGQAAPDGEVEAQPDAGEAEAGEAGEEGGEVQDPSLNEAPEFWSAEDKAAWNSVPPALRPMLKKIDQDRVAYVKAKEQEAAKVRQEAIEQAKQATTVVEEGAKWWQANGPQFFKAFGDKWAQVNWVELAEKDPAECQRLRMLQEHEAGLLRQAHERGQRDIAEANKRAETQFQEARRTEHEKIAAKHPDYFGTPDKAAKTYKELSQFLFDAGIPAERISAIYEAPIVELALDAMRFRQAKKQASSVAAKPGTANTPAARTPLRVAPGPGAQPANQGGERARLASERIRRGGSVSVEEAAALANSLRL
jgi:hypothetical protein